MTAAYKAYAEQFTERMFEKLNKFHDR